ncbi:MAG: hypothetical protein ASARMPRED_006689 [Alectoria sarmentosa]|nr:MAG: hypothetical protein ASARMPRED_006689 [Alectoria sarmentosa]
MIGNLLLLILLPIPAWVLYSLYCLASNYNQARKMGLSIVILPIDSGNPLWMSVDTHFIRWFKYSPFGKGRFTRFNWRGWEIQDRYRAHQELGDAFVFVTPGKNWLQLCNAEALADVFQRRDDFVRPIEMLDMLNVFGPNLGTTEGQQWQRHRKVTAACFNEQNNVLVWSESVRQATEMLEYWSSKPAISSVADDVRTLSLHVLSSAGFGKSYPFRGSDEDMGDNDSSSYQNSLKLILDNCIPLMALGPQNLSKPWLPSKLRKIFQATVTFKNHMTEIYEGEKKNLMQSPSVSNNLMTSLIRASQEMTDVANTSEGRKESRPPQNEQSGLTETEIYGNIFVFNFAGHDTTANVLTFAVVLLATRPDIQDWMAEELQFVLGSKEQAEWSFHDDFPRLKRCLAVLVSYTETSPSVFLNIKIMTRNKYETVRLYTPVAIVKSTTTPQELRIDTKNFVIPANTMIIPSYSALQTHPRHWGPRSLEWEPKRWIMPDTRSTTDTLHSSNGPETESYSLQSETFLDLPKKASPFIAWSGGLRSCPGRKFSQVEFVAVMAGLFREARVKPVLDPGENDEMARRRIALLVERESGMVLLLQILRPEKARLVWERRGKKIRI